MYRMVMPDDVEKEYLGIVHDFLSLFDPDDTVEDEEIDAYVKKHASRKLIECLNAIDAQRSRHRSEVVHIG